MIYYYIFLVIILASVIIAVLIKNTSTRTLDFAIPVRLMHEKFIILKAHDNVQRALTLEQEKLLPTTFDMWNNQVPVVDQGPWGSCTAFSFRYALLLKYAYANLSLTEPSTSYVYDQSRIKEGNLKLQDSGATNTDVVYVMQNLGVPPLSSYPYTSYNLFHTPPTLSGPKFNATVLQLSSNFSTNISNIKNVLLQNKAVVIGFNVYSSMMTNSVLVSGTIPQPGRYERIVGGHSIALTGYNDTTQRFLFRNSWGSYTGNSGLYTIPYNYIANAAYAGDAYFLN